MTRRCLIVLVLTKHTYVHYCAIAINIEHWILNGRQTWDKKSDSSMRYRTAVLWEAGRCPHEFPVIHVYYGRPMRSRPELSRVTSDIRYIIPRRTRNGNTQNRSPDPGRHIISAVQANTFYTGHLGTEQRALQTILRRHKRNISIIYNGAGILTNRQYSMDKNPYLYWHVIVPRQRANTIASGNLQRTVNHQYVVRAKHTMINEIQGH